MAKKLGPQVGRFVVTELPVDQRSGSVLLAEVMSLDVLPQSLCHVRRSYLLAFPAAEN